MNNAIATVDDETGKGGVTTHHHSSMFLQSLSSIHKALESKNTRKHVIHAISRRLVPCGPNPLHN
ncbi:hypothetical protein Tsubulata_042100 [Turnera subulata]|uniref:Uncharacterized protein n=1 Tax=Turnera subulata TaxID=218843 RepID=A0A9Q0GHF2_9ROSI|nr:hypothetical protein Tsubulata_042100 [Turnera subulata]